MNETKIELLPLEVSTLVFLQEWGTATGIRMPLRDRAVSYCACSVHWESNKSPLDNQVPVWKLTIILAAGETPGESENGSKGYNSEM